MNIIAYQCREHGGSIQGYFCGIRKMILGLPLRNIIVHFCFSKKWFGTI